MNPHAPSEQARQRAPNKRAAAGSRSDAPDSHRAMFLVRGGSEALQTVAQSIRQRPSMKCQRFEYHLVTGEPDVVVVSQGPLNDLNQFFLHLAENLSGSAVVAGQPLSIIPYLMENCIPGGAHGESCWSSENCGEGKLRGFVEVDIRRSEGDDFSGLETLSKRIARKTSVNCVSQISRWDRLMVVFDGIPPSELSKLVTWIRGDGLVLATRTRVFLPPLDEEENGALGTESDKDAKDTFLFLSTGRKTAELLHQKLSDEQVDSWMVYGQTDIVVRLNASSRPNALAIASGIFPPLGAIKGYRGPERVSIRRVKQVKDSESKNRNGPQHLATLTIDVKGYGQNSKLQDLADSLSNTTPEIHYVGSVCGLNVILVQIAMKTRDALAKKIDQLLESRREMIRTTTIYLHVGRPQKGRQTDVTARMIELKAEGVERSRIRKEMGDEGYDASKLGAIITRVYGRANKER